MSNDIDPLISNLAPKDDAFQQELRRATGLYSRLFLYLMLHFKKKTEPNELIWQAAYRTLKKEISETYTGSQEFRCLLGDSLLQLSRIYPKEALIDQESFSEDYLEQFEPGDWSKALSDEATSDEATSDEATEVSSEFYYTAVERYTDQQRYQSFQLRDVSGDIDAFYDLGFFKSIFNTEQDDLESQKK